MDDRQPPPPFHNLYRHGFARVAVATPRCKVADPAFNVEATIGLLRQAAEARAVLVAFPELGLSAYTCDDLFHQQALLEACEAALGRLAEATRDIPATAIVGLPMRVDHLLFNCAAVVHGGRVLGIVPKTHLPNYGEFYEARQFVPAAAARSTEVQVCGQTVPFGARLLFQAEQMPLLTFHIEICEDVWVPIPPSSHAALAGATVLVNLSASNITVGKAAWRHRLVDVQSARCLAAYLYSSAGYGESTTDLAWDGQALIYENGELMAQAPRFSTEPHFITADIDLERLSRERMRQTSFGLSAPTADDPRLQHRTVRYALRVPNEARLLLERPVERFPYVPADDAERDERCFEVFEIQAQGLTQRLAASGIDKLVIGISGGLDSTHALLVCAHALDKLGRPRSNILAYTMPGFATSGRTLDQARRLMQTIGCTAAEIDIRPSCEQMLRDLGHPYASGERGTAVYDLTFENVQAGERTSHLFRLANLHGGLVVGTGDLSELALGWCTYGVGDHMSHYNVNASVPKTLIRHLVRWVAEQSDGGGSSSGIDLGHPGLRGTGGTGGPRGAGVAGPAGAAVLRDVLDTAVSPELVPGDDEAAPTQLSEASVGPYELQDFHLYYTLRFGFRPSKVAFLAYCAWHDADAGRWPEGRDVVRRAFDLPDIKRHLKTFLWRFFKTSQFKRSCVPNAPKVGSGGSLSPRGDWRAPSDSEATAWMEEAEAISAP